MASVFVVEPYFSGSHRAWAQGFAQATSLDVSMATLPGRFWKWRMFGGSLTLAREVVARSLDDRAPDALLVSDMVDLPSFLGHAGAALGDPVTILYMHENQLTYPLSPTARDDLAYAYMNWSSMVRADEVWFNTEFHLESVFGALPGFLRHFPDHRHTNLIGEVRSKCRVMPVGVDLSWVAGGRQSDPPLVVWNQRWEHDKNPERMFAALDRLARSGADFTVAICGENFRNVPTEFEAGIESLGERVVHAGFAERGQYETILNSAAVVLSTADHEFFGIAAVEAMAAGAFPVFPNDLSYPELVPDTVHEHTLYETDDELDQLLTRAVRDAGLRNRVTSLVAPSQSKFGWEEVAPRYDRRIEALVG